MEYYSASLIISFYNRVDYLKMILAALQRQSIGNFEVIISDDGSKQEVIEEITRIKAVSRFPIQHVWHKDDGFRKTTILNESIRRSRSEYLIFIDGDCIPHHKFIEEHYSNRKNKIILAGRRANISPKLVRLLDKDKIELGCLESGFILNMIWDGIFGKSTHVIKGIYVKNFWLRKILNRKITGVLGSNFSIHKTDIVDINGFDERYKAPAVGEDTDIEVRLRWNGVNVKMLKNIAVQFHFDHQKLTRSSANMDIYKQVLVEKNAYTKYGLKKVEGGQNGVL